MTIPTALAASLAVALAADTAVAVFDGPPGATVVPDVVAVLDARSYQDGEEEAADLTLVVSCYVGGGPEAQPIATARAYSLLAAVHARLLADPTLSGSCRVAAVNPDHRYAPGIGYDATGRVPLGRVTEISATVTVHTGRPMTGNLMSAFSLP